MRASWPVGGRPFPWWGVQREFLRRFWRYSDPLRGMAQLEYILDKGRREGHVPGRHRCGGHIHLQPGCLRPEREAIDVSERDPGRRCRHCEQRAGRHRMVHSLGRHPWLLVQRQRGGRHIPQGRGVYGRSYTLSGVEGVSGNVGPAVPNLGTTAGVFGTSGPNPGLIGTSNGHVGVFGFSNGAIGVVGQTLNPASFAGYFSGNVIVLGNFTVTGGTKSAAVAFPDGSQRVLYCMESPELWFEDFGTAKLKRGRALVDLDADFAKVIKRGDYRVFLTPEGDCHGLYVRRKTAASFEVRELMGGKSSIAFSYASSVAARTLGLSAVSPRLTRVSVPASPPRPLRKPSATASRVRAFVAQVEREARAPIPKRAKKKRRRSRALPKPLRIPLPA